jgi:hypothetical protein
MVKIVNCCYTNLNQQNIADFILGEDITTEITVGTSPIILLASINTNRKIVKLFSIQYSDKLAQLWVRHGTNINSIINNGAFAIPEKYLYVNNSQASRPLSIVMSEGTALIKLTVVNKL